MSEQGDLLALTVLWVGLKMSLEEYSISRNLVQRGLKRKIGIPKIKYGVPGITHHIQHIVGHGVSVIIQNFKIYFTIYNGIRYNAGVWIMQKERKPGDTIIP